MFTLDTESNSKALACTYPCSAAYCTYFSPVKSRALTCLTAKCAYKLLYQLLLIRSSAIALGRCIDSQSRMLVTRRLQHGTVSVSHWHVIDPIRYIQTGSLHQHDLVRSISSLFKLCSSSNLTNAGDGASTHNRLFPLLSSLPRLRCDQ